MTIIQVLNVAVQTRCHGC